MNLPCRSSNCLSRIYGPLVILCAAVVWITITISGCDQKPGEAPVSPTAATSAPSASPPSQTTTDTKNGTTAGSTDRGITGMIAIDLDGDGPRKEEPVSGALVSIEGHPETTVTTDPVGAFSIAIKTDPSSLAESSLLSLKNGPVCQDGTSFSLTGEESKNGKTDSSGSAKGSGVGADVVKKPFAIVAHFEKDGKKYGKRLPNLILVGGSSLDLGKLRLAETGAISGSVSLSDGTSPIGIDVYIPGTSFTAKASADGEFLIMYVPEGEYSLIYEKSNYGLKSSSGIRVVSKKVSYVDEIVLPAIDSKAPDTSITLGPSDRVSRNEAIFEFHSTEHLATFECRLDNSNFSPCRTPILFTQIPEGNHVFEVVSVDPSGNTDPTPTMWRWAIDLTPPLLSVVSRPESVTASPNANLVLSSSESGVTYSCFLDGFIQPSCSANISLTGLTQGYHSLQVSAQDLAGNTSQPLTISWQVDSTVVDTILLSGPQSLSPSPAATVNFVANKPASFMCQLDIETPQPCLSPVSWTNLTDGSHTLVVVAKDSAGRNDPSPLNVSWTVDTQPPPSPLVHSVPNNLTNTPSPVLSWTDAVGAITYDLEVDSTSSFNSPLLRRFVGLNGLSQAVLPQLTDGVWYARIRARDASGNISEWSTAVTFTLDTQPPAIPVTEYLPDLTNNNRPQFTWQDTTDAIKYRLMVARDRAFTDILMDITNNGALELTPSNSLPDGPVFWKVAALDQAGNQSQFSLPKFFTIDTSLPATPAITGSPSLTNNSRPTFSWSPVNGALAYRVQMSITPSFTSLSINDAGVNSTSFTPAVNLPDNIYYVRMAAINSVGTQGGFSVPHTIIVDTTPPPAPILNAYSPSTTNDLTPTLTWSDGGGGAVAWDILIKQGSATIDSQTGLTSKSYTPLTALPVGVVSWQVRARDGAGNVGSYATASTVTLTSAATWKYKFPVKRTQLSGMDSCFMGFDVNAQGTTVALGSHCTSYDIITSLFKFNRWGSVNSLANISSSAGSGSYVSRDYLGNLLVSSGAGKKLRISKLSPESGLWSTISTSQEIGCLDSSCWNVFVNSALDSGLSVHIIYSLWNYPISNGLHYINFNRTDLSWSDPVKISSTAENPIQVLLWEHVYTRFPYDFIKKHHDIASISAIRGNQLSIFYRSNGLGAYLWKVFDAATQTFVLSGTYPSPNKTLFANAERFYLDDNGWPVIESYTNGSDLKWNGSAFAVTSNPNPKLVMSVSGGTQAALEKDTILSHTLGTTTNYHTIEDDDGMILTAAVGGVSLTRYGHPFTGILNQTTTSVVEVAPSWKVWSIDKLVGVGSHSSLSFDSSGNPAISYRSGASNSLKVASYDGSNWTTEIVDASLGSGYHTSIGRKSNGKIVVAHYQANTGDLKLATQGVGGGWSNFTIDSTGDVGKFASLAMNGDNYAVAYHDESSGTLKLASFDGTSWNYETVDQGADVGEYASFKIQGSTKHIAYYDVTNHCLKYAKFDGNSWAVQVVDDQGDVGKYASIALKSSGKPMIAYYDATNTDLKFAEFNGTTWNISTLQTSGDIGSYISIAVDAQNEPHICSYDATNTALSYSSRDVNWSHRLIDGDNSGDDKGMYCSLVLNPVNGSPSASYYDSLKGGINFVDGMVQY